jgi:hypothetical protein
VLLLGLEKKVAVGQSSLGVVNGAWPYDNQQPLLLVLVLDNRYSFVTAFVDYRLGLGRLGDFGLEQVRRSKRVVATNCDKMKKP